MTTPQSAAFSQILMDVFSSAPNGRFRVEATGLQPEVDEQIGSRDAAISRHGESPFV